ncbi:hypothetical protein [Clostridium sardiniense]|uniref:hypothetical protein n=1 Tax=Clostridium sardiniense TaxID=29369 RepID=UPI003D359153
MKKSRFLIIISVSIILLVDLGLVFFTSSTIMFPSRLEKDVEKYWNNNISVKDVKDFESHDQKYKIILSTKADNEKYKYLNIYEEKLGGLYYKCDRASEQGDSKALTSFSIVDDENNNFTIVYGYNKGLEVDNYEADIIDGTDSYSRKFDLPKKEYFIDVFNGRFGGIKGAWGSDGSNKNDYFLD